jgi:valyl-tRNA synthetase
LQDGDDQSQRGTRHTLVSVLDTILRLAHPLMPFITEEIWQRVAPLAGCAGDTLMRQAYPVFQQDRIDPSALTELEWVMSFILGIRRIRGEMNIAPGKPLPVLLESGGDQDREWLDKHRELIAKLGRIENIQWLETGEQPPESAIALLGQMRILIPMQGLIDKHAELARLEKEIQRIEKDLPRLETKLGDPDFIDKAPAPVVEKERAKLDELRSNLGQLREQAKKIQAL